MSALHPLGRPWRQVERLPPASLATDSATQNKWVCVDEVPPRLLVSTQEEGGFSIAITRVECTYKTAHATTVSTVESECLLGAKVVARGVENGQIRTAIALVFSGRSGLTTQRPPSAPAATDPCSERLVILYECSARDRLRRPSANEAHHARPSAAVDAPDPDPYVPLLPLAVQEHIAAEINHFLELLRGKNSVRVDNDTLVDDSGVAASAPAQSCTPNSCARDQPTLTTPAQHQSIRPTSSADSRPPPACRPSHPPTDHNSTAAGTPPESPAKAAAAETPHADRSAHLLVASPNPPPGPAASPFSAVFTRTRPICRPWQFTPLLPLAPSQPPSISTLNDVLSISLTRARSSVLSLFFRAMSTLLQLFLCAYLASEARITFRRQAYTIFQAARCANNVIESDAVQFPSQLALYMLHAHGKARSDHDAPESDPGLRRASIHSAHPITPFHRSPLCVKFMSGSTAVYLAIAFLSWAVAVILAYVLIMWMYETAGVHGAWFGLRLHAQGGHIRRTAPALPTSSAWNVIRGLLRSVLQASEEQLIPEPVIAAKVAATLVQGPTVHTHIELHTATKVYRLTDPAEQLTQASQALIVAAINRHLHKLQPPWPDTPALPPPFPLHTHAHAPSQPSESLSQPPTTSAGRVLPHTDLETLTSVFVPIRASMHEAAGATQMPEAEGARAVGRPLRELQAEQAAAIRAVNFERDGGTWTSSAVPPRASADITLALRQPGRLCLRVTKQCSRWLHVCLFSLIPLSPLLALLLSFIASSLLPPLRALRVAPVCGAAAGALAFYPLFLKGREVVEVRIHRGGFSVVRVPWWLPVPPAIALAIRWPFRSTLRGKLWQLAGAEVHVKEGHNGCHDTSVLLHVRRPHRSTAARPQGYSSCLGLAHVVPIMTSEDWHEAIPAFTAADKLFVAGHINGCISELQWQELAAVPEPADEGSGAGHASINIKQTETDEADDGLPTDSLLEDPQG